MMPRLTKEEWPMSLVLVTLYFFIMGALSFAQLWNNWGNWGGWLLFAALVIAAGICFRQNWALWLGILWSLFILADKIWKLKMADEGQNVYLVYSVVLVAIIYTLTRYSFSKASSATASSEEVASAVDSPSEVE